MEEITLLREKKKKKKLISEWTKSERGDFRLRKVKKSSLISNKDEKKEQNKLGFSLFFAFTLSFRIF